jgi:hypothetical protein
MGELDLVYLFDIAAPAFLERLIILEEPQNSQAMQMCQ